MGIDGGEISKNLSEIKQITIPEEAKSIVEAASDLDTACSKVGAQYRTVGSLAIVGAIGKFHRIPGDIDAWYDESKSQILRDALKAMGYSHSVVEAPEKIFPYPLEHFVKNGRSIELRGGNFTNRGIEYPLLVPIPGIPVNKRPQVQLVSPTVMVEPILYTFENKSITALGREALWVGLNSTIGLMDAQGDKLAKRKLDLELLSKDLDPIKVSQILAAKPGIYFNNFLILGSNSSGLMNFSFALTKTRKFFLDRYKK